VRSLTAERDNVDSTAGSGMAVTRCVDVCVSEEEDACVGVEVVLTPSSGTALSLSIPGGGSHRLSSVL